MRWVASFSKNQSLRSIPGVMLSGVHESSTATLVNSFDACVFCRERETSLEFVEKERLPWKFIGSFPYLLPPEACTFFCALTAAQSAFTLAIQQVSISRS
jgi:hypothetical protein